MRDWLNSTYALLVGLMLLGTGCAVTTHRQYSGFSRSKDEVAVVKCTYGCFIDLFNGEPVKVDEGRLWFDNFIRINGNGWVGVVYKRDEIERIEVLPGTCELGVRYER